MQAQGFGPPDYITISSDGPDHEKTFVVEVLIDEKPIGSGSGRSKQYAAKEAARYALELLGVS